MSKLNDNYLDFIYDLYLKDQINKRDKKYDILIKNIEQQLLVKIDNYGFPGDKIIGINDSLIFQEKKSKFLDLYKRIINKKDLKHVTSSTSELSASKSLVVLVHHKCFYQNNKLKLIDEMKKGNIHPRDLALLHDNIFRFSNDLPSYCNKTLNFNESFMINLFTDYPKNLDLKKINENRKKLFIVSIEIDNIKKEYEKLYGFKLFSGFWDCR